MNRTAKEKKGPRKRYVFLNMDASESAIFGRQLEYVETQVFEQDYPELIGRDLIPVKSDIPSGAETYTYYEMDKRGAAKIISDYANDLPRADCFGRANTSFIKSIGDSYGYNLQEIRAAQMAKMQLDTCKAEAARQAIEEKIDKIAQIGDTAHNLLGLLNQPNVSLYTVPNGAAASPLWTMKTPDEILKDLNGMAIAVYDSTLGIEFIDTLILPPKQYGLIASTPRSEHSDTTILKFFLSQTPWVKAVVPWYAVKGAGAGGTDRMVGYRRDKRCLELLIPQEFESLPPQPEGLSWIVPCHARSGGVIVRKPLSIVYGDGI